MDGLREKEREGGRVEGRRERGREGEGEGERDGEKDVYWLSQLFVVHNITYLSYLHTTYIIIDKIYCFNIRLYYLILLQFFTSVGTALYIFTPS